MYVWGQTFLKEEGSKVSIVYKSHVFIFILAVRQDKQWMSFMIALMLHYTLAFLCGGVAATKKK